MRTRHVIAVSLLAGVAFGAGAVQVLHAQAKPPAYVVAEIDVHDATYDKEYVPGAIKAISQGGGTYIVRGGATASLFGEPPKPRIAIMVFANMDAAKATFSSPAYLEAKKVGDKYASFRIYAVEGMAP
jgi:uncharacterized protein (DUF1330 family)